MPRLPAFLACLLLAAAVRAATTPANPALPDGLYAEFTTPRGVITAELHYTRAPLLCANFTGLAEGTLAPRNGQPFYTGLTWYRVVPGFVLQSGNPGLKDTDDEKTPIPHRFPDEFAPGLSHDAAGILSMANAGPDTNGCEFFLTLAPVRRLDYLHGVFGRVVRGLDVLPLIRADDAVAIRILRQGAAARAFRADAAEFARLAAAAKPFTAAREPGPAAHFDDPDGLLPTTPPRAKAFTAKLANLERATGLRLYARLRAKSPTKEEDAQPGAFMRALAQRLGTDQRGALAVYFADEDDWRVWVGDELTRRFTGLPGEAGARPDDDAIHAVKEPFLQAAQATGNADFKRQQDTLASAGQPAPLPGQRIKLQTDAILDGLIAKLVPPAPGPRRE
jgi:cyclophilin family peptidyl-prolyl cis-trans isomerase